MKNYGIKKALLIPYEAKNMITFHHLYKILKNKYVIQATEDEEKTNRESSKDQILKQKTVDFFANHEVVGLFHYFCSREDMEMVKLFLEEGYNPNNQDENGKSSIFVAIDGCKIELIKFLLSKESQQINVNLIYLQRTPYTSVLNRYHLFHHEPEIITLMENNGAFLTEDQHQQLLNNAYYLTNKWLFEFLVTKKFINKDDGSRFYFERLIAKTVMAKDMVYTRFLLNNNYNVYGVYENTLLMNIAIANNHIPMIDLLFEFNINADFNSSLILAVKKKNLQITKMLIERNSNLNFNAPLKIAIENKDVSMIKLFVDNGAEMDFEFLVPVIEERMSRDENVNYSELLRYVIDELTKRKNRVKEVLVPCLLPSVLSSIVNTYSNPFNKHVKGTDTLLSLFVKSFDTDKNLFINRTEKEAYEKERLELVSLIAQHTNLRSIDGTNTLITACQLGNKDIIRILTRNKASITEEQLKLITISNTNKKLSNNLIRYVLSLMADEI
jgi:ankyrin repeat protein